MIEPSKVWIYGPVRAASGSGNWYLDWGTGLETKWRYFDTKEEADSFREGFIEAQEEATGGKRPE